MNSITYNYNSATTSGGILNSATGGKDFTVAMTSNSFYSNSAGNGIGGGFNIKTTSYPTSVTMTSCSLNYMTAG